MIQLPHYFFLVAIVAGGIAWLMSRWLDDALSDELESYHHTVMLPAPELGNLPEIEHIMRNASMSQVGRDTLSKIVIRDDYVAKLLPLVGVAEDLESLADLHRLCNIMKALILLNDNAIIENVVTDPLILGVVGALECACLTALPALPVRIIN